MTKAEDTPNKVLPPKTKKKKKLQKVIPDVSSPATDIKPLGLLTEVTMKGAKAGGYSSARNGPQPAEKSDFDKNTRNKRLNLRNRSQGELIMERDAPKN